MYFVHLRTYRAAGNRVAAAGGDKQIQAKIVRYPYGSTQVQHTYNIVTNAPTTSTMAGISVRGKRFVHIYTIFTLLSNQPTANPLLVNGSGGCSSEGKDGPGYGTCGFTTSNRHLVFGVTLDETDAIEYDAIGGSWYKSHHGIDLPRGYSFGNLGCNFHSYKGPLPLCTDSRTRGRIARSGSALHAASIDCAGLDAVTPRPASLGWLATVKPLPACIGRHT